jgi:hypothetical protein
MPAIRARERDDRDLLSSAFLDLERPLHHERLLSAPTSAPGGLNEAGAQTGRSGLGDAETMLRVRARILAGHESQVRFDGVCTSESRHVVDRGTKADGRDWTHTGRRHESTTDFVVARDRSYFAIGRANLHVDRFQRRQHLVDMGRQ